MRLSPESSLAFLSSSGTALVEVAFSRAQITGSGARRWLAGMRNERLGAQIEIDGGTIGFSGGSKICGVREVRLGVKNASNAEATTLQLAGAPLFGLFFVIFVAVVLPWIISVLALSRPRVLFESLRSIHCNRCENCCSDHLAAQDMIATSRPWRVSGISGCSVHSYCTEGKFTRILYRNCRCTESHQGVCFARLFDDPLMC